MAMITTAPDALDALFRTTIIGLTPRTTYKGAETWKGYYRDTAEPTTTRRFCIVWRIGSMRPFEGGAFTPAACEYVATFAVRTDYCGQHEKQQPAIIEDSAQLALALSRLRGDSTGIFHLTFVEQVRRSRSKNDAPDVVQIDHVFQVRFLWDLST